MRSLLVWFLSVLSATTSLVSAQQLLWRREGIGGTVRRGFEIRRLGDVNSDGWEDLVEWGETDSPGGVRRDAMFITSGQDGSILSTSPPLAIWSETYKWLSLTAAGDMNQDGVPDYAVTVYDGQSVVNSQRLEVHSGTDHALIWSATIPLAWNNFYGWAIGAGDHMDLDGDGHSDLVASATRLSPAGTLIIYDHYGVERYRLIDPVPTVLVGVGLAPLGGDLDGDGCDDFLAAGPDTFGMGAVVVFSGLTGNVLRVSRGVHPNTAVTSATGCGDLDGDGVLDYAGSGRLGGSVVTTFSGATGLPLHTSLAPASVNNGLGFEFFSGFDLDQDGVNDLVVGSDNEASHAISGRDGSMLWTFPGSLLPSNSWIGYQQVLIAPPPGEKYPVHIFSEHLWQNQTTWPFNVPGANGIFPGLLRAYRGCPKGVSTYGQADASPGQRRPRMGMRDLPGQPVRWTLSDAPADTPSMLLLGLSDTSYGSLALPAPLDPFGMSGFTLLTSAQAIVPCITGSTGAAAGYAQVDLALPPNRVLGTTGLPVFAQWLWFDASNLAVGGSTVAHRFFIQ